MFNLIKFNRALKSFRPQLLGIRLAIMVLCIVVALFIYLSRDKFIENMENAQENNDNLDDTIGRRGMMGPRGLTGKRGPKGESGGEYKMMGRLADATCLEKGDKKCHLIVNKLGGKELVVSNKGYGLGHIWRHETDGTLRGLESDKCVNVKKNDGVGKDSIVMGNCDVNRGATKWHYGSDMSLQALGTDSMALSLDGRGNAVLGKRGKATKWTFFD